MPTSWPRWAWASYMTFGSVRHSVWLTSSNYVSYGPSEGSRNGSSELSAFCPVFSMFIQAQSGACGEGSGGVC